MKRREFLTTATLATLWSACSGSRLPPRRGRVLTVRGWIEADQVGAALAHEHILVDFAPVDQTGPHRYDRRAVIERMLPFLHELRSTGVRTIVDATPAYLGRDPILLRALSEESGLHVLTNTGYYGARDDVHLPAHAWSDDADTLAQRWIREYRDGLDGTDVRPGFIKIGVDPGSLSDVDARLVRAAGNTHLETGLTIAAHTGPSEGAMEQLDMLRSMGIHPSAWIWVHAQAEENTDAHVTAGRLGAWVEFDGVRSTSIAQHVELVLNMKDQGLLNRVLVSQDAGWYHVGEEGGGEIRGYTTLHQEFVPALLAAGLTVEDVDQLLRRNPADAYGVRVRAIS